MLNVEKKLFFNIHISHQEPTSPVLRPFHTLLHPYPKAGQRHDGVALHSEK